MRSFWRIFLVAAVIVTAFIPSIFGEFITADDVQMIDGLRGSDRLDFLGLFFGQSSGGLYFRPLLMGSFYLDKIFWSLSPFAMRFENVLLHLFSALVIYGILRALLREEERETSWLPFFGALLFGLNPLVTESVNWVSGRTDLLAGCFLFLSTLALVKYRVRGHWLLLAAAAFAALGGMLSKEVAVGFAPGAMLLLTACVGKKELRRHSFSVWGRPFVLLLVIVGGVGLFAFLRSFAVSSNSSNIGLTLKFILNDPFYDCLIAFRLLGFYLKKMFFPWPLNFAILEVDPLYELLGMVLFVVCVRALFSRKYSAALFLTGVFLLAPTFPLVFNRISWTPYAERYAYIASGFVIAALILFARDRFGSDRVQFYAPMVAIPLLVVFFVSTWQRNHIWQTNESLWQDTVEKSPTFSPALNEYALLLFHSGELDKAAYYFKQASSEYRRMEYKDLYDCSYAEVVEKKGEFLVAEQIYRDVLAKTKNRSKLALQGLSNLYERELLKIRPQLAKNELNDRLLRCQTVLAELDSPSSSILRKN